jgi:hypothetical protein
MLTMHHDDADGLAVRRARERKAASHEAREFSNHIPLSNFVGPTLLTVTE